MSDIVKPFGSNVWRKAEPGRNESADALPLTPTSLSP